MIHLNDSPDAPDWSMQPIRCRRCMETWHAGNCEPLAMPDCELGAN